MKKEKRKLDRCQIILVSLAALTLVFLIAWTTVSILRTEDIVSEVNDRIEGDFVVATNEGFTFSDIVFYLIAVFLVSLGIWYDNLFYYFLSIIPLVIAWCLLLVSIVRVVGDNEVRNDFGSRVIRCEEVEITREDNSRVSLDELNIEDEFCEANVSVASVALLLMTSFSGALLKVIKDKLDSRFKNNEFTCDNYFCKAKMSFVCICGDENKDMKNQAETVVEVTESKIEETTVMQSNQPTKTDSQVEVA